MSDATDTKSKKKQLTSESRWKRSPAKRRETADQTSEIDVAVAVLVENLEQSGIFK